MVSKEILSKSHNRTSVELKRRTFIVNALSMGSHNRTSVELKPS